MKRKTSNALIISLAMLGFFVLSSESLADTVRLKNGNSMEGLVVANDKDHVVIEVEIGKITFARDEVEEINIVDEDRNQKMRDLWQEERERSEKAEEQEKEKPAAEKAVEHPAVSPVKKEIIKSKRKITRETKVMRKNLGSAYYLLKIPPDYNSEKKWPLVIGLHWYSGNAEGFMNYWRLEAKKSGLFIACPKSSGAAWDTSDVARVFKMIDDIKKSYNIDTNKIYLVGHSNGANFAVYLGLSYPEKFRAVACVAGSLAKALKYGKVSLSRSSYRHIPVLIYIGDKDEKQRLDSARQTKRQLEAYGYPVYYKEIAAFPMFICHGTLKKLVNGLSIGTERGGDLF